MNKVKLYVPVINASLTEETRDDYLKILKNVGADMVFIAAGRWMELAYEDKRHEDMLKLMKENLRYFEKNGIDAAVWCTSLGFGGELNDECGEIMKNCKRIESVEKGLKSDDAFCPEDENFMEKYRRMITDFVKAGAKMIMIDDDLCLSVRPGLGCFCETHKKIISEIAGEPFPDNPEEAFFSGKPSKWRHAWYKAMHDTMIKFCKSIRETVDLTDDSVRLGFCAGFTSWDIECADAIELTMALAGKTKPFLRLTGAPYWVIRDLQRFPKQRLQSVIDLARLQTEWLSNSDIEFFVEDDTCPRPRYHTSAALCESFDLLTRTSGKAGCLKYMIDYSSTVGYETGYEKMHVRNRNLARFIDENFQDKEECGICVYEPMHKFENMELPKPFAGAWDLMCTALSNASAMVSLQGLPLRYGINRECTAAFGEAVRDLLGNMPEKLIIDFHAAKILMEHGVDTGIISYKNADTAMREEFMDEKTEFFYPKGIFYDLTVSDKAAVYSYFEDNNKKRFIGSYRYKSDNTEFLVFAFDSYTLTQGSDIFLSYKRQEQLLDFCGNMPHFEKEPNMYIIMKKNREKTALLIANLGEDSLYDSEIILDKNYKGMNIFGAEGKLQNDRVKIGGRIAPFDIFAVILDN